MTRLFLFALLVTACSPDAMPVRNASSTDASTKASDSGKSKSKMSKKTAADGSGSDDAKTVASGSGEKFVPPESAGSDATPGTSPTTPTTPPPAAVPAEPLEPLAYPSFELVGSGDTSCKDRHFINTQKISTALTADTLTVTKYYSHTDTQNYHQDKADEHTQKGLGPIIYARPSKDEVKALKAANYQVTGFAIFAKSATKPPQQKTYIFDKPIPVYPLPATVSRYKALADAPGRSMTWTTNVSGSSNFPLTVTVTLGAVTGSSYVVTFHADYPDPDHTIANDFPIPANTVYTIDGASEYVAMTTTLAYFNIDHCNRGGDQATITYIACSKNLAGKISNYSCPTVVEVEGGRGPN